MVQRRRVQAERMKEIVSYADAVETLKGKAYILQTLENSIQPQAHIFVKDKDPWIEISDKSICYDKMYDREKTWSTESLDRIRKIEK